MKPTVLAGVLAAVAAAGAFGAGGPRPSPLIAAPAPSVASAPAASARSLCPAGTLPDEGVCIPVPPPVPRAVPDRDSVPKLPDREADFARYRLPVEGAPVTLGRRPESPLGASDVALIEAPEGAAVRVLALEGQEGAATVVYAGPLVGQTLVTRHRTHLKEVRREYLVVLGFLGAEEPFERNQAVPDGTVAGHAGPSPVVCAVRLLRPGADPLAARPEELLSDAVSVPVDPRNVFPLR